MPRKYTRKTHIPEHKHLHTLERFQKFCERRGIGFRYAMRAAMVAMMRGRG